MKSTSTSEVETVDISAFLPESVKGTGSGMVFPVSFQDCMCLKIGVLFSVT